MAYREKYITLEQYRGEYKSQGNLYIGFVIGYGYCYTSGFAIQPPHMNGYSPSCGRLYGDASHYIMGEQQVEDTSSEAVKLSLRGLFINGEAVITIKSGMTLSHLAALFDVTVEDLVGWNNIKNRNMIQDGQRIRVRDKNYIPNIINVEPRDQGEIKPYKPNFFGIIENWLHSPTEYLRNDDSHSAGAVAMTKFAGRVVYSIFDDAWVALQCVVPLWRGHTNAAHMNGSYVIGTGTVSAGVNTLTNIVPWGIGKIGKSMGISGKVVNSAQFNTINKGTGVTSATKGGYYIRQYNFNNKEFLYMKSTYGNFSNTFSIVSEVNENEK